MRTCWRRDRKKESASPKVLAGFRGASTVARPSTLLMALRVDRLGK